MKFEKTVQQVMDNLQKNLADAITKSFDSIDFDEVLSESIRKSQEKELSQKRDFLKMALDTNQILLLDESFRRVGKTTMASTYAKENNTWVVCSNLFNRIETNPQPRQFWSGAAKQVPRGLDRNTPIIADDISLDELQELYLKGYKNISGFARKY